jgi:hypothetical protein
MSIDRLAGVWDDLQHNDQDEPLMSPPEPHELDCWEGDIG